MCLEIRYGANKSVGNWPEFKLPFCGCQPAKVYERAWRLENAPDSPADDRCRSRASAEGGYTECHVAPHSPATVAPVCSHDPFMVPWFVLPWAGVFFGSR